MGTATPILFERKGHWLLGALGAFREDRLRFLTDTAQMGPIVRFRLGPRRCYLVSDPDLVREVLVTRHPQMARDPLVRRILEKTLGGGLLTSDGAYWKRQRRMIAPALHLQRVRGYADLMVEHALAAAGHWRDGEETDVEQAMDQLTLSIVTAALFRVDSRVHAATVAETLPGLQEIARRQFDRPVQIPDWLPTPEHRRQRELSARLNHIVMEAISARRARVGEGDGGDDLLTMMVQMTDAETGERMTDEEIRAEVITLYLAGYETTALTLTYVWYELARQPALAAHFQAELERVLGGRPPRIDDLDQLHYTRMLFKEALRLYPPAYFMVRAVAEPITLGGHAIPRGSVLLLSPFAMHRDPSLWDAPERFDPTRFADDAERTWHKFKYFPFGGGPRICIGNQFALVEGQLLLATLGQLVEFELLQPDQPLTLEPQITLGPKGGMPMRLHRRARPTTAGATAPA
ncbi:cytochrome P450 [Lamprocystis purpurea]|uniref:cytochrome P450 n=1 Tax=Lamprocystis purpurea TaxID=61598 RepID=UPI0003A6E467|nr:cytochrome P450 [Lamprocystis purpurea]